MGARVQIFGKISRGVILTPPPQSSEPQKSPVWVGLNGQTVRQTSQIVCRCNENQNLMQNDLDTQSCLLPDQKVGRL